ncbi:MAG: ATP-binding protein [Actinomycetota bacterium]
MAGSRGMTVQAERESRLSRTFLEIASQLTQHRDIDLVLATIVQRSMELCDAPWGAAATMDRSGEMDKLVHSGLSDEELAALRPGTQKQGLLELVLRDEEVVRSTEISEQALGLDSSAGLSIEAFVGVPIVHSGHSLGGIFLGKAQGAGAFTDEDEDVVISLASLAAIGIENARLFAAEKERGERSALLGKLASDIRSSLEPDRVLITTVEQLGRAADVRRCYIRLVASTGPELLGPIETQWSAPGVSLLGDQPEGATPVSSLAAATRATHWSDDTLADERLSDPFLSADPTALIDPDGRAAISTPLRWGDELFGVVTFHDRLPRHWTDSDIQLIEGAAREVSAALHHARLYNDAVKTAEELRDLDQTRSDFVTMVSHEIRSPMTVVAGIADVLRKRRSRLSEQSIEELTETLAREARRLAKLVSEILDLEAIDRGGMELEVGKVDVAELAKESIADAGESGRITLDIAPGDMELRIDRDKIKQVLLNLISNAAKFAPEGTPITVRVHPEEMSIVVRVEDEGPGIPPEKMEQLFQRFSRLEGTKTKPGSGLGLYLSRLIVERHGGVIWADSEPGGGATFAFRLPREPPKTG